MTNNIKKFSLENFSISKSNDFNIKIISKEEYLKDHKKPDQEEVWDNISDLWNEYRKVPYEFIKEFLRGKKGLVIDLGCGSGRNMLASPDLSYYGVDFSGCQLGCAITHAEEFGINAKFFKHRANRLSKADFKKEMFDYGLFIATLHCIEGSDKRLIALKEFYRVLKKGAEGLITVWNSDDFRFNGLKGNVYMSWKKDGVDHMRYYYLYSKKELFDLIKSVGFEIVDSNNKQAGTDRFSKKNWIIRVRK